jgi:heptosyltransferase-3
MRGAVDLARRLRALDADAAIVVHPRPRLAVAVFLAGIPVRVGTAYRAYSMLFNRRVPEHRRRPPWKHEAEHNLNLLTGLGLDPERPPRLLWTVRPEEAAAVDDLLRSRNAGMRSQESGIRDRMNTGVASQTNLIAVHPGNAGSSLNWAPEQYGDLGRRLAATGYQVVVTGSASEVTLTGQVSQLVGEGALDLGGRLTLGELGALIQRCGLFVGSATGPTHLAATVGTPVLAVYSPLRSSNPVRWRPLGDRVTLLEPRLDIQCRRCRGQACPFYHCMHRHLAVDEAERAARQLLAVSPEP